MSQQANPMDAAMAFWKEAFTRFGSAAQAAGAAAASATSGGAGPSSTPGAAPGGTTPLDPAAWMPTPEMVRRMQSAFLDAMAAASEQYMRSPQFLDAMKASLDGALRMRQEMDALLRRQVGEAMSGSSAAAAGGSGAAGIPDPGVVRELREMEARLQARLDEIDARLSTIEETAAPSTPGAKRTTSGGGSGRGSARGRNRRES